MWEVDSHADVHVAHAGLPVVPGAKLRLTKLAAEVGQLRSNVSKDFRVVGVSAELILYCSGAETWRMDGA